MNVGGSELNLTGLATLRQVAYLAASNRPHFYNQRTFDQTCSRFFHFYKRCIANLLVKANTFTLIHRLAEAVTAAKALQPYDQVSATARVENTRTASWRPSPPTTGPHLTTTRSRHAAATGGGAAPRCGTPGHTGAYTEHT